MRDKLATKKGRQIYSRRKVIVEPVFGQTKEARRFRRFSLRGLRKVRGEWTLVCLCGNLLKLVTASPQTEPEPAQSTDQPPRSHRVHPTRRLDAPQQTNYQKESVPQ